LGFEKRLAIVNEDGTIVPARLRPGSGTIVIGTATANSGRVVKPPDELGGAETRTADLVVPDADSIDRRARAAGAVVEIEIKDENYGGRGFACRDLEDRLWTIGTDDPWKRDGTWISP
jgi:uncharacterized glyoxalase superfamily protein PhnB